MTSTAPPPIPRWWLSINGSPAGPFEEAQIVAYLNAGQVPQYSLICLEGSQQWQPLTSWPAFARVSGQVATLPYPSTSEVDEVPPEFNPDDPRYHYRRAKRNRDLGKWAFWIPWPIYLVLRFFNWLRP